MGIPSYDSLLHTLLNVPLQEVHKSCTLTLMLAKPTKSVQNVLKRLNGLTFTCEYKYDGEHAQVRMTPNGEGFKVFSHSLLNTSEKFPRYPSTSKNPATQLPYQASSSIPKSWHGTVFRVFSTRKRTEKESTKSVKRSR